MPTLKMLAGACKAFRGIMQMRNVLAICKQGSEGSTPVMQIMCQMLLYVCKACLLGTSMLGLHR
jgi:hypothetical protein